MSANERLATLENWQRLKLERLNNDPKNQVIALINNRNDRVARSKVFAAMLSNDLRFDRVVVIGSNVEGFYSYFLDAFIERVEKLIEINDLESLDKLLEQFNLLTRAEVRARFRIAYGSVAAENLLTLSEGVVNKSYIKEITGEIPDQELTTILYTLRIYYQRMHLDYLKSDIAKNNKEIKERLISILQSKVTLLDDSNISADEITNSIADLALPNTHQVVVGMQNIKGAGLNYVYAWQQWQKISQTITNMLSKHCTAKEFRTALTSLNMIVSFNLLETDYLKQKLDILKKSQLAQNEFCQAEITTLQEKVNEEYLKVDEENSQSRPTRYFNQVIESFLDAGAAVKRKKRAIQIYNDIAEQRITLEKAIKLLSEMNRNQKSGWFTNKRKLYDKK